MNTALANSSRPRTWASPVILALLAGFLIGMFFERIYRFTLEKRRAAVGPISTAATSEPKVSGVIDPQQPEVLMSLLTTNLTARQFAIADFVRQKDRRIVSPMILLQWAGVIGLLPELTPEEINILKSLTGQDFEGDWNKWAEWWWRQEAPPEHPGFAVFQASLFGAIDPGFPSVLHPQMKSKVRRDEIIWGGVRFDGIPALINPAVVRASSSEATVFQDEEPVFGVSFGGEARAYPLRILDWHEMVNDSIGDQRFFIAYCTLCGSAIAYDSYVDGVGRFVFGSSGLLRRSNKLMYDRETRTLWSSMEGRPILGPLAMANPNWQLRRLPIVRTSWGEWKRRNPETTVLSLETGFRRDYTPGQPYGEYFASPDPMFPIAQRNSALKPKDWIYGVSVEGAKKAYPLKAFEGGPVLLDEVGGKKILVLGNSERLEVRAYETDGRALAWDAATQALTEPATGRSWRAQEDGLIGPGGEKFQRLPGHLAYWFAWYAAYEQAEIFQPSPR